MSADFDTNKSELGYLQIQNTTVKQYYWNQLPKSTYLSSEIVILLSQISLYQRISAIWLGKWNAFYWGPYYLNPLYSRTPCILLIKLATKMNLDSVKNNLWKKLLSVMMERLKTSEREVEVLVRILLCCVQQFCIPIYVNCGTNRADLCPRAKA